MASDLGLTPNNDGRVIRLQVPQLTAVRRSGSGCCTFVAVAVHLGLPPAVGPAAHASTALARATAAAAAGCLGASTRL